MNESSTFMFRYPLWMLHHPTLGARKSIINAPSPNGERAFLLFTDEDLATRFRATEARMGGYEILPIRTEESFLEVLRVLKMGDFTHVIFDHPGSGVGLGVGSPLFSIAELRAGARGPGDGQGTEG